MHRSQGGDHLEQLDEFVDQGLIGEVLGLDRVGVREGFLELGGDSILAIAVVTKARALPGPAKTTSRGSSPTSSVRTTAPVDGFTTRTLSERWLTTQTSVALRTATATGS